MAGQFFVGSTAVGDDKSKGVMTIGYDVAQGRVTRLPHWFVRYLGSEREQMVAAVALGPDGLYFAPLLPEPDGTSPLLKVTYAEGEGHPFGVWTGATAPVIMRESGCIGCHTVNGVAEGYGPPLDSRGALAARLESRLHSPEYMQTLNELDARTTEPFVSLRPARQEVRDAPGRYRARVWVKHQILHPQFDKVNSQMPAMALTEQEARQIAAYLIPSDEPPATLSGRVKGLLDRVIPSGRYGRRHIVFAFAGGVAAALLVIAGAWALRSLIGRRRPTPRRASDLS